MNRLFEKPYPRVRLHPATLKHLKKGHPWTTKDNFTEDFPQNRLFLIGVDANQNESALLLHDPNHPKIKARAWTLKAPFIEAVKGFRDELYQRLQTGFNRRLNSLYFEKRENVYMIFGEADLLPGLFIQKLGNTLLIQLYARFWINIEDVLLSILRKVLKENDWKADILIQERYPNAKSKTRRVGSKKPLSDILIVEDGLTYQVHPGRAHDPGIYTDAASIRFKLTPYYSKSKSVLNLYSYTGAFSLKALKEGAENVVSVDLSGKYLNQLERNLVLNPHLNPDFHKSIEGDVNKVIGEMIKEKQTYDMVICDPPSASSDGKKISSALKNYEKLLPKLMKLTADKGKLVVFLNTHSVTRNSFKSKIQEIIKNNKSKFEIVDEWALGQDCPLSKGFPEGDYLKVLVLKKIKTT